MDRAGQSPILNRSRLSSPVGSEWKGRVAVFDIRRRKRNSTTIAATNCANAPAEEKYDLCVRLAKQEYLC